MRSELTFHSERTRPAPARSSGTATLSRSQSSAGYTIGMHGSDFSEATRVIRIRTRPENTVSTVSSVRHPDHDPRSSQPSPGPGGAARDESHRAVVTAADDADGADAKAGLRFW